MLLIRFPAEARVSVGALGRFPFPAGDVVYVGSARRGLDARVARHLRRRKSKHWHADYLTSSRAACVAGAVLLRGATLSECALSRAAAAELSPGSAPPVPRFGTGDCREECPSHLWRAPRQLTLASLARFAARVDPGAAVDIVAHAERRRRLPSKSSREAIVECLEPAE